jgi:hypothetical protein
METKAGYNLLMAETRDEWDRWNMIACPFGKKKGFWWAMIAKPASLANDTVLEGEDCMVPDPATPGTMVDASAAQLKAYKSDMEAQSYLAVCLKNYTDLLREAQMAGNSAFDQYDYLDKKFRQRDHTKLYTELQQEMRALDPNEFDDGYKFIAKIEKLNREVKTVSNGNEMNDIQLKVFLFMKIWKPEKGEVNAWTSFTSKYDEDGVLNNATLEDFKQHMKNHWTQHGSPGDPSDVTKKALNVHGNRDPRYVPTCETCGRKGHTGEKCWKDEKNANQRPSWWKNFDKEEFHGKCFQCGETGHKGFQCKKKPIDTVTSVLEEVALVCVEEKSVMEEMVMTQTEKNFHDYYHSGWVKNPNEWYEKKKERRGPYYKQKRWSFDMLDPKTDDEEDEMYNAEDDVEDEVTTKMKIYDLRKIPMKKEEEKDTESDYGKNQLFYESGEEVEDEKRNGFSGKTASEENEVFESQVRGILGMGDDVKPRGWKRERDDDVMWTKGFKCMDL